MTESVAPSRADDIRMYHEGLLAEFASLFDVDHDIRTKQLSLGMRVGSGPVHVPHALRGPLVPLRARGEPGGGDRFSATLAVGQRLEPWIAEVMPPAAAAH